MVARLPGLDDPFVSMYPLAATKRLQTVRDLLEGAVFFVFVFVFVWYLMVG